MRCHFLLYHPYMLTLNFRERGLSLQDSRVLFIYCLYLAVLMLHCRARAFSVFGEQGWGRLLFVVVHRLLVAVASLVAERGL